MTIILSTGNGVNGKMSYILVPLNRAIEHWNSRLQIMSENLNEIWSSKDDNDDK